jgi:negative regulator of genetic competence, sporulation and motility
MDIGGKRKYEDNEDDSRKRQKEHVSLSFERISDIVSNVKIVRTLDSEKAMMKTMNKVCSYLLFKAFMSCKWRRA